MTNTARPTTNKLLMLTALYSAALIITGLLCGPVGESLSGLGAIVSAPAQLTRDYFKLGTVGGAFLNAGLIGLACTLVLGLSRAQLNSLSLLAYFLTVGFGLFGTNIMNIWPCILGTWLYAMVTKQSFAKQANMALFSTALAPFVSEAICRYPLFDSLALRIGLGIIIGLFCGFMMPIVCSHTPTMHKGYSMYNAACGAGFIGIFLFAVMFRAAGVEIPANTDIGESHPVAVNVFHLVTCLAMITAGLVISGRSFKPFMKLMKSTGYKCDYTLSEGVGPALVNIGVFGLFTAAYYWLTGAAFTGPTAGVMICLLGAAAAGAHVLTMLPIMLGYCLAAVVFSFTVDAQAIAVGLCFAAAMAPISGRFGSVAGIAAGFIHAAIVTTVVTFHGGFVLYNGGFTSGITALILVPVLEHFFTPCDRLRLLPLKTRP